MQSIIVPLDSKIHLKQIRLDECIEEPYLSLKSEGKYADEIIELPDGSLIILEKAEHPKPRDFMQVKFTLEKLRQMGKRIRALGIIAGKSFTGQHKALIDASMGSLSSKYGLVPWVKSMGECVKLNYQGKQLEFRIGDCEHSLAWISS